MLQWSSGLYEMQCQHAFRMHTKGSSLRDITPESGQQKISKWDLNAVTYLCRWEYT